jgi:hypothetical protein
MHKKSAARGTGSGGNSKFFNHQPIFNQKTSPCRERRRQCPLPEIAMYRVLFAIIILTLALEMSGCTGSLRLGGEVPAVMFFR